MGTCVRCGDDTNVGSLCPPHARELAHCTDITAEQIVAAAPAEPAAWLIDQWGATHPLAATTVVGRDRDQCGLALLHHSVSALHAQLEVAGQAGRVQDRGSLNGTYVNGDRVRGAPVFDGDVLQIGDVRFFFSTAPVGTATGPGGAGRTVPSRNKDLALAVVLAGDAGEIELVQRVAGGIARIGDDSLELARLEFGLLHALVERKRTARDPELAYVSSAELATSLDFKSREADSDNVRELVRRVRKKLATAGVDGVIESRQGVGYRIAWELRE